MGVLLIVISAAAFGALPILTRLAYRAGADPPTVLLLPYAIAAVVMVVIVVARKTPLPRGRILFGLILMGAVGYVGQSLAYLTAPTLAQTSLVPLALYFDPDIYTILAPPVF